MRKVGKFSLIVPCFNEQEVLPWAHGQLTLVMQALLKSGAVKDYEIIYVDDGSTDSTIKVLQDIFTQNPHVRILTLRRNFGFQGAITAGLFFARGDAAVTRSRARSVVSRPLASVRARPLRGPG